MKEVALPIRAFQWDLARQIERLDWMERQLPRYADWGYSELYLHLEDAVEYPSLPGVARKGAYTHRQLGRLVEKASRVGIAVVPIANLLGHTQYLIKVPSLRDLNECRAPDGTALPTGQLCPLHPRTFEVAQKLISDLAAFCTAGKIHVGLDESYHLGRHPWSQAEIAQVGRAGHFARYVGRLHGLAQAQGLRLGLWADMLALLPEAIAQLPPGVIAYDWYYYPFTRRPKIELRNFADYDMAPACRAQGVEYWGCPMNGAFRHEVIPLFRDRLENIESWWRRCLATKAGGILITSWEANRLAAEMPVVVDAAAASLWLDRARGAKPLLQNGCRRVYGKKGRDVAKALMASDAYPFSGYPRWQVNDRWDTVVSDEPIARFRSEALHFSKVCRLPGLPPVVRATFAFRDYLAQRDLFIRRTAGTVWSIRREPASGPESILRIEREAAGFARSLASALKAARVMWEASRSGVKAGPNERLLESDSKRLRALRTWIGRSASKPSHAWTASPVAGAWQINFTAENREPAAQKIVVHERVGPGGWEERHGLFMIEFQAAFARSRARRVHRISVPIDWKGPPFVFPEIRVVVRGFGRVWIADPILTNGGIRFHGRFSRKVVGQPAARRGYPDFNGTVNRGSSTAAF